ncbi:hypothetical protein D3C73_1299700 [compost metagenome]
MEVYLNLMVLQKVKEKVAGTDREMAKETAQDQVKGQGVVLELVRAQDQVKDGIMEVKMGTREIHQINLESRYIYQAEMREEMKISLEKRVKQETLKQDILIMELMKEVDL